MSKPALVRIGHAILKRLPKSTLVNTVYKLEQLAKSKGIKSIGKIALAIPVLAEPLIIPWFVLAAPLPLFQSTICFIIPNFVRVDEPLVSAVEIPPVDDVFETL